MLSTAARTRLPDQRYASRREWATVRAVVIGGLPRVRSIVGWPVLDGRLTALTGRRKLLRLIRTGGLLDAVTVITRALRTRGRLRTRLQCRAVS
jgi:hypothetical protein